MKHQFISFILLSLILLFFGCQKEKKASLVLKNGQIYTANVNNETVQAMAIDGNTIVFVGTNQEVKQWVSEQTEVIDLEGKTVTPGLIEGHGHFLGMGYNQLELNLLQTSSYEEIIAMVEEAAKKAQPGDWIVGRGWHQSKWDSLPENMVKGFQTHHDLSKVSPENPVYLKHASGHAALANKKAMEVSNIYELLKEGVSEESETGEIILDENGNPTGIFNEVSQMLIAKHIPEKNEESDSRAYDLAVQEAWKHGITAFHDAGIDYKTEQLYLKKAQQKRMGIRMYAMLSGRDSLLLEKYFEQGPLVNHGDGFLTMRSIKMYMDGALGSRGAWLLKEYSDRKGHFGHETTPMEKLDWMVGKALIHGFQVCAHAIGDRANQEVLDTYEKNFDKNPSKREDSRFRIEHAQHLHPDDIVRFGELGVIASMQAIHMSSDRPWAIERLGIKRIRDGAYVWKKLINSGAVVTNGTDVPVEPVSPMASFYASISRKTLKGTPEEGYEADQRMSRDEALKAYTFNNAFAAFQEKENGSIEVGKWADLAIFDQDFMQVEEAEILNTEAIMTIIDGKIVYQK